MSDTEDPLHSNNQQDVLSSMRTITNDELKTINGVVQKFETTHRAGEKPLFQSLRIGWFYKVKSATLPQYIESVKAAFTEDRIDPPKDSVVFGGESSQDPMVMLDSGVELEASVESNPGLDFIKITDLYTMGEFVEYFDSVMKVEARKTKAIEWIRRNWELIRGQNAVGNRLKLLTLVLLENDMVHLKIRDGYSKELPDRYKKALHLLEHFMTTEADMVIQELRRRNQAQTEAVDWFDRLRKNKCALKAAMLFLYDCKIPKNQRFGSSREVYEQWEKLDLFRAICTEKGWQLMNDIYGGDWTDQRGRKPTVAMKRVLTQVMGLKKTHEFFHFIERPDWNSSTTRLTLLKKKQFLVFGFGKPQEIPFRITGSPGASYRLFGVVQLSWENTVTGPEYHAWWTLFEGEVPLASDKSKIHGWKTDRKFEKITFSLNPCEMASAFVFKLEGPPLW